MSIHCFHNFHRGNVNIYYLSLKCPRTERLLVADPKVGSYYL